MKPIFWILTSGLILPVFITAAVSAGEISPEQWTQFQMFLEAMKGMKGFGTLTVAGIVVQLLLTIIKANSTKIPGRYQIFLVQALSIIAGVIGLRLADFDWASAFLHSNTLGAVQVFLNQIYKQLTETEKKYELPAVK